MRRCLAWDYFWRRGLLTVVGVLLTTTPVLAQATPPLYAETGRFPTRTFGPRDYEADPYIWYAARGNGDLMYFANLNGVLEFDGVTWRTIPTGGIVVRSLAADAEGRIYVGTNGNLGYLAPDSTGLLAFVSLRDRIAAEDRTFGDVWQLYATSHGIYFCTFTHIFRWSPEAGMQTWRGDFHKAFAVRDTIYVRHWELGLVRLDDEGPQPIPGGERFIQNPAVTAMMPYGDDGILVATHIGELFLYDGTTFVPFVTEADAFLRRHLPYYFAFAALPNGIFALGTRHGGVVLFDQAGRLLHGVDQPTGLQNNQVFFIETDRQGGLWLCHPNGLTRLAAPAPLSYYDDASGLSGNTEALLRHQGKLYAATSAGVFVLVPPTAPGQPAGFKQVDDGGQCWDLLAVEDRLLASCTDGLYEVVDEQAVRVQQTASAAFVLQRSQQDATRLYIGLKDGLASMRLDAGQWINEGRLDNVIMGVRTIEEERDGTLWLGGANKVLRVDRSTQSAPIVEQFDRRHGLGRGYLGVYNLQDRLVITSPNGIWHLPDEEGVLRPDTSLGIFSESAEVSFLKEDAEGDLWLLTSAGPVLARKDADGAYRTLPTPLVALADWSLFVLYPDLDGIVWMGGSEGLVRYDPSVSKDYAAPYSALVRRVATANTDSLIFGGSVTGLSQRPILASGDNALRFSVGAASFDQPPFQGATTHRFQFLLEGLDKQWSPWTEESRKDYTNLPGRTYVFRVRARNAFGLESREGTFAFTVLPPWYQTWWAYVLYGLFGVGIVYGATRWRLAHLEARNRHLEAQVAARTTEVEQQKTELETANTVLEQQTDQLHAQAEQLRELDQIKSHFFANLSHEFRTPLTLILGPLQDALAEAYGPLGPRLRPQLRIMQRNSARLLGLINQLLDLAKLESGSMMLRTRRTDLIPLLKSIVFAFASRAERKQIALRLETQQESLYLYVEPDKVEKVVVNLLSNAFKFTPEGGQVNVACRAAETESGTEPSEPGYAEIIIHDTGAGIPADALPHIFDRFYQIDGSATRTHEGTGIGLALVKELVALHGGAIHVESEPENGTTFIVRLPLGKDHLAPEDILENGVAGDTLGSEERNLEIEKEQGLIVTDDTLTDQVEEIGEPDSSAPTILIVEDHPDVRAYLKSHLALHYRIEEAVDGREGLEMARLLHPDLVISDVMMPRMDGYALCEAIKTDDALNHIPVILLTAKADEESKIEGLETGADDYIYKPFNREELLVRAENLIEIRRLLRRRFSKEVVAVEASEIDVVPADAAFLEHATHVVEAHLTHPNFGVDWLADEVGMSLRQLQRKLKNLTGLSPSGFIRTIRLQRAAQLLEQGAGNVSEIAFAVGFANTKHFSRLFRQIFGVAPSQYPSTKV